MQYGIRLVAMPTIRWGDNVVNLKVPLLHYGWCRKAQALAISRAKHHAWYADGAGLEDGHIPDVEPYDFKMKEKWKGDIIKRHTFAHPASMSEWLSAHQLPWHYLNGEIT